MNKKQQPITHRKEQGRHYTDGESHKTQKRTRQALYRWKKTHHKTQKCNKAGIIQTEKAMIRPRKATRLALYWWTKAMIRHKTAQGWHYTDGESHDKTEKGNKADIVLTEKATRHRKATRQALYRWTKAMVRHRKATEQALYRWRKPWWDMKQHVQMEKAMIRHETAYTGCLLYTSPSPRDGV